MSYALTLDLARNAIVHALLLAGPLLLVAVALAVIVVARPRAVEGQL